ncbi:MAG: glycosyltransferase [Planctomycetota bacterium]
MRIALLSWESLHSIAVGGLAAHVSELAAALSRRGHEVHLFTRMGANQTRYDFIEGVHYHRCPFDPNCDFVTYVARMCDSIAWHVAETEAHVGRPFDIVHGHDWLTTQALSRIKNEHRRPVMLTIHSTEFGRCGNAFRGDPTSVRIRHLEWEGTYIADRVICVSKALADETQWCYGVPGDKLSVVYNGVDVGKYDTAVDVRATRRRYDVGVDDPMILFAGRMAWQKGPDMLLETVPSLRAEHPRTKVVFAGDGDMRAGLEDRAGAIGSNGTTRFVGYQTGQPLIDLFKSSDVVCVPSRNEPFGIVILEAWSAAKPVVATRTGGPKEFVTENETGIIVDLSVEELRSGLGRLLADRSGAERMGRNGRREAERRFTWDHAASITEGLYEVSRRGADDPAYRLGTTGHASPADDAPHGEDANDPLMGKIRERAQRVYAERIRDGRPGTPQSDWLQAEREIRGKEDGSYQRTTRGERRPSATAATSPGSGVSPPAKSRRRASRTVVTPSDRFHSTGVPGQTGDTPCEEDGVVGAGSLRRI